MQKRDIFIQESCTMRGWGHARGAKDRQLSMDGYMHKQGEGNKEGNNERGMHPRWGVG